MLASESHWNGPVSSAGDDGKITWATLPTDAPFPTFSLAGHFTRSFLFGRWFPLPFAVLASLAFVVWPRRAALRPPADEAGYACYRCTRAYFAGMGIFWVALGWYLVRWSPVEPLTYVSAWAAAYETGLGTLLFTAIASVATIGTHVYLLPVYQRLPGSTWSRRDLAAQAGWWCALAGTLVFMVRIVFETLHENPVHAFALACVGAAVLVHFYLRLVHSLGFVIQSLDVGVLRERVESMAEAAGIKKLWGAYLLYRVKSPILNALAAKPACPARFPWVGTADSSG